MPITPEDIQHKEFPVRLRGFDIEAVDTFLEEVAEDLFHVMQENDRLRDRFSIQEKRIRELEEQLKTRGMADPRPAKIEAIETRPETPSRAEEKLTALRNQVRDELRETLNWYVAQLENPVAPEKSVRPIQPEAIIKAPEEPKETEKPEEQEVFLEPDPEPEPEESLYEKIDLPETPHEELVFPIKRVEQVIKAKVPPAPGARESQTRPSFQEQPVRRPEKKQPAPVRDSLFGPETDLDHGPEPAISLGLDED